MPDQRPSSSPPNTAVAGIQPADGTAVKRTCMRAIGSRDRPLELDTLLDHKLDDLMKE